ncbi:MAG: DUF362 domain-containing protein [Acidobacteriota bacterium]
MHRRDFLKDLALGGALLRCGPSLLVQAQAPPDLAVVQGDSPASITREALALLGGMRRFIAKGDKVMIKPNIGWDRTPELAACTNPVVVRTLVELCFEAGAKEVTVMDNTTNQAQRCYARSGIADAAKAAGAKVPFVNTYRLKKMALRGEWLKEWEVFTDFVETDKLINVPIAKHHSLSRLTIGMKNWLGAIGGARSQLHQKLDEAMVDLAAFFKPTLTVLDAYRILTRNGPQGGRTSDVRLQKTVAAGVDPVAADAIGATFFEIKPEELTYIMLAQKRGLGKPNLESLRVEKRTI